jgi:hypothetical protein
MLEDTESSVKKRGPSVILEGQRVGWMEGFNFIWKFRFRLTADFTLAHNDYCWHPTNNKSTSVFE